MARPKVSPAEKRSVKFSFRLTESERGQLLKLAQACGCAPGILIRDKLFTGRFPSPKAARIDIGVYAELKKIGVNVNQLAKQVNSGTVLTAVPALLNDLLRQQDKIINLLILDRDTENR